MCSRTVLITGALLAGTIHAQGLVWTPAEQAKYDALPQYGKTSQTVAARAGLPPPPVRADIRELNGPMNVKNQGSCGSCVSNSITTAIEYESRAMQIRDGKLAKDAPKMDLSVNQLINCLSIGCKGQDPMSLMARIKNEGVFLPLRNPWEGSQGDFGRDPLCVTDSRVGRVYLSGAPYRVIDVVDVKRLLSAGHPIMTTLLANGDGSLPLTESDFTPSAKFIKAVPSSSTINHAVVIVGYDDDKNGGEWIIQNSWGESKNAGGFVEAKYGSVNIGNFIALLPSELGYTPALPVQTANGGCDPTGCWNALRKPDLRAGADYKAGVHQRINYIGAWNVGGFIKRIKFEVAGQVKVIENPLNKTGKQLMMPEIRVGMPGLYNGVITAENPYGVSQVAFKLEVTPGCTTYGDEKSICPAIFAAQSLLD